MGRLHAWLLAFGPLALAVVACGPSFQVVYEGDVRFEHCYGIDQTAVPADSKKECWRQWLKAYTYGQSRDRVEYAASRVNALSVQSAAPDDPPGHIAAAPMPTSAFAPPPNIATSAEAAVPAAPAPVAASSAGPRMPGSDCAEACESRWTSCRSGCRDATCANCDRAYRGCMPPCFKDEPMSRQPVRSVR